MQTITFYSYNGGTGRSLAVANAAKHLVRLKQKVFAIDLDLEAPGLHYKLELGLKSGLPPIKCGFVDYMHTFFTQKVHSSLSEHTIQVRIDGGSDDTITLMPAGGNVPCAEYWHKLTQIDWHSLFYSRNPEGIPFFLELKARIEKEYSPDFLLIDSRTGITEIGGVATTILPDRVVCLLLNNRQNLEGSRAVLQGIAQAPRFDGKPPIEIMPVLARIPWHPGGQSADLEESISSVKAALSQDSPKIAELLNCQDVLVLHSDRSLEVEESLFVGGSRAFEHSPLLRDYLRLFSKMIPSETVAPHLEGLIAACWAEIADRPEKVQVDLKDLAENYPDQRSFLALLKFYRVRQVGPEKMLGVAASYWELSRDSSNPLLWEVISEHFRLADGERSTKQGPTHAEFIEAVWSEAGAFDVKVGERLADLHFSSGDARAAVRVLKRMIENSKASEPAIVASIKKLVAREQLGPASELVDEYRAALMPASDFQVAWARLIIKRGDEKQARELVESKDFRPAKLQADDPTLYVRLLALTGRTDELSSALHNALDQALVERDISPALIEVGTMLFEFGKGEMFRKRVREVLPEPVAEHVMQMVPRRRRRHG